MPRRTLPMPRAYDLLSATRLTWSVIALAHVSLRVRRSKLISLTYSIVGIYNSEFPISRGVEDRDNFHCIASDTIDDNVGQSGNRKQPRPAWTGSC